MASRDEVGLETGKQRDPKEQRKQSHCCRRPPKTVLTVVSSQAAAEAEPGTGRKAGAPTSMLALLTVTHTLELLRNHFLT